MQTASIAPVSFDEKLEVLVSHFLEKASGRNAAEIPRHIRDTFGTETLGFLIETLEVLKAPDKHWNKVAEFVLGKTNRIGYFYYTPTLASLSPHVSIEVREKIVKHFVLYGDLDHVVHITTAQLFRMPTADELVGIAKHHRRTTTSSKSEIWNKLISLSRDVSENDETSLIQGMLNQVIHEEEYPTVY